jgi:hypothetical protein
MSKFSMFSLGGIAVRIRGFFCRIEIAKMLDFTVRLYRRAESSSASVHSHKSAGIVRWFSSVPGILNASRFSQICPAIIKRVVVDVIGHASKNFRVHVTSVSTSAASIKTLRMGIPFCTPVPLIEPFVVNGIDNCRLALRERDKTVGCIERLDNCVSFHAVFHSLTSNEIVIPAAILA